MKKNYQKNSGSALLITMLLIGTIGVILLIAARTNIIRLRTATNLSESQVAYYAAEAGIEEGLLAYRADRSIEVPITTEQPSEESTDYRRVILGSIASGDTIKAEGQSTNVPLDPTKPTYDMKIYSRGEQAEIEMKADDILQFKRPEHTFNLEWEIISGGSNVLADMEYAYISSINKQWHSSFLGNDVYGSRGSFPMLADTGENGVIRIRLLVPQDKNPGVNISQVRAKITMKAMQGVIDLGYTYIESIGYFGQAKRKLQAKIDNQSGALIGIFDFTLYAGDGNITQ